MVPSGSGADFGSGGGCGICTFSPYSGSIATTSMNMMIRVSSTSISGVTLICGPDGPPPAIEKDMEFAPLRHARVCNIRHLWSPWSSWLARQAGDSRSLCSSKKTGAGSYRFSAVVLLRASDFHRRRPASCHPLVELLERQFTLQPVTLFAVTNLLLQRRKQIEGDICGLKVLRIGVGHIVRERTEGRGPGRGFEIASRGQRGSVHPGQKSGGDRLHIALDAANLPGKENLWMRFHLQCLLQQSRRIDVGVAVNLSVAQKTRILQAGNQAQHARLFAKLQMILESHQVVGIRPQVLLPQLHHRIGHLAGAGIDESHRLHRTEAKGVAPAASNLLNRQAALKIVQLFPIAFLD